MTSTTGPASEKNSITAPATTLTRETGSAPQVTRARMAQMAPVALDPAAFDDAPAQPISARVIARASEAIDAMRALDNVATALFPTDTGGLRFYWPDSDNQMTVDVELSGAVYVHVTDLPAGTYRDETIPADSDLTNRLAVWLADDQ